MGLTHSRANLKKIIAAKVICSGEKILTNLVCGHSPTHLPSLPPGVEATLPQEANNPTTLLGSVQNICTFSHQYNSNSSVPKPKQGSSVAPSLHYYKGEAGVEPKTV